MQHLNAQWIGVSANTPFVCGNIIIQWVVGGWAWWFFASLRSPLDKNPTTLTTSTGFLLNIKGNPFSQHVAVKEFCSPTESTDIHWNQNSLSESEQECGTMNVRLQASLPWIISTNLWSSWMCLDCWNTRGNVISQLLIFSSQKTIYYPVHPAVQFRGTINMYSVYTFQSSLQPNKRRLLQSKRKLARK